jgi:hypothetical protein
MLQVNGSGELGKDLLQHRDLIVGEVLWAGGWWKGWGGWMLWRVVVLYIGGCSSIRMGVHLKLVRGRWVGVWQMLHCGVMWGMLL